MELHEIGDEFIVKLFYKGQTDTSIVKAMAIPGCEDHCTVDKLFNLRKHILPVDWELECGLKHWYIFSSELYLRKF